MVEPPRAFDFESKLSKWVPNQMTETERQCHIEAGFSVRFCSCTKTWSSSIVPRKKGVMHANIQRKRWWCPPGKHPKANARPTLHLEEFMQSIWLDSQRVLLFAVLLPNSSIPGKLHWRQLDLQTGQILLNHPNHDPIPFLLYNARPPVAIITRQKLLNLGEEVSILILYSPDIVHSSHHLFLSMSSGLRYKAFSN